MGIRNIERKKLEKLVLLIIFVGLLVFLVANVTKETSVAKQKALYHELIALRQGVNLFQVMEKRYPTNLIELATAVYQMPGSDENRKFVDKVKVTDQGKVVDPFGNPYDYNPRSGWVKCTTDKFAKW